MSNKKLKSHRPGNKIHCYVQLNKRAVPKQLQQSKSINSLSRNFRLETEDSITLLDIALESMVAASQ